MIQLLGNMKISVKLPVMVKVDNEGAIFMACNIITTLCTKHMDIRFKYVKEYTEDSIVKITYVKSSKNDSNILSKMLSAELHEKHSKNGR